MSDHWFGDAPTGRQLNPDQPSNLAGSIGVHDLAEPARLKMARKYFDERDADDFVKRGRVWIDRDGAEFRRCGWDPLAAELGNRDSNDLVFFVAHGRITYLRPRGLEATRSSEVGTVVGGELTRTSILSKSAPVVY
jgi:hypothetical protein